ncbi:phytanoyl- dioxygenase family protein [Penicillium verhagenii]|uniref:phytanoyl- dioxygenase family protein n=1 Tax=Penicillium verhagenii TaxID=1562060 RepID=UPI00254559F7|nr:phytanoyl- dioxygenase family protein [Penicillium verhagenii]KAJ5935161.1 phytanoyl- dioxygenase family protein [Penicillium verhagenii]
MPESLPSTTPSAALPLPEVKVLNAGTTTTDEVVEALRDAGGCIVRGLIGTAHVDQIEKDLRPYLNADKSWDGKFYPPETRRCCGLLGKSRTFALQVIGNRLWNDVCDALLTSTLSTNWVGNDIEESISHPQLSNTICFSIGPGAADQPLHRDDDVHHHHLKAVGKHEIGRDVGVGLFVAGKKATKANGATRFIPGSHLWDYSQGPPREEQTFYAEMQPGDAFFMLSGCFHGGSANRTENEERLMYSCFFTRGWLRQEENQILANPIEAIRVLPEWLQERVGFGLSRPFLGWVDLANPMHILHPEKIKQRDLW